MSYQKYMTQDTHQSGIYEKYKPQLDNMEYNYKIIKALEGEDKASEYLEKKFNELFG